MSSEHHYNLRNKKRPIVNEKLDKSKKQVKLSPIKREISHEDFHKALKISNVKYIKSLLEHKSVKLCRDSCYILAQNRDNPAFLTTLLEYDSSGINAIDKNGDTLLIREIRDNDCENFELLIEKGADVNICNNEGYTALHYATINKQTPIEIIKKLIESKANLNKALNNEITNVIDLDDTELFCRAYEDDGSGDTPLICLLKNFDYNGLEKVKLLIESGADVNLRNKYNRTPLMIATSLYVTLSTNINLIKYLLDKGAKAGLHDLRNNTSINNLLTTVHRAVNKLPVKRMVKFIYEYYIPAIDLLIKAGDDMFLRGSSYPLRHVVSEYKTNLHLRELVLYLIKIGFMKIEEKPISLNNENYAHPIVDALQNISVMENDKKFDIKKVLNIILYHSTKESKFHSNIARSLLSNPEFTWRCIGGGGFNYDIEIYVSIVGMLVTKLPLEDMKHWLIKFKKLHFTFENKCFPLLVILLIRFLKMDMITVPIKLIEVMDYLLENNQICTTEIMFKDDTLEALQATLQIPDCIWISAVFVNLELLMKFLPYWNQHPLTLILFLRPWLEIRPTLEATMLQIINKIHPYLIEIGGHVSHGTTLYNMLLKFIKKLKSVRDPSEPIQNIFPNLYRYELYTRTSNLLEDAMNYGPVSLKVMCRTIIRANAVGHGNNLPMYLQSLVPPGLKKFISLKE